MTTRDKIRVMIVDDHPLFLEGLRHVLEGEDDLDIVAEISDGKEALERSQELSPDIILLDINLPSMNGLQVTRQLKSLLPQTGVIIITAHHDEQQMLHAIRAGAVAYYPKEVTPATLVDAIHKAQKGNYLIDNKVLSKAKVAAWLLEQFEELEEKIGVSSDNLFVPLSPREMEVLQHITRGKSNKEIARDLSISRQTVKNHMTSILRKLAVNDRTQAAIYALRRGWIRFEDTKFEDSAVG